MSTAVFKRSFSMREAAAELGYSYSYFKRFIAQEIPYVQHGDRGPKIFQRADLETWRWRTLICPKTMSAADDFVTVVARRPNRKRGSRSVHLARRNARRTLCGGKVLRPLEAYEWMPWCLDCAIKEQRIIDGFDK